VADGKGNVKKGDPKGGPGRIPGDSGK